MKLSLRSFATLVSSLALIGGASAQLSGLKTNLRTFVDTGLGGHGDTHQYLGPVAGPTLGGHSEAFGADVNASGTASADASAAFGDLSVDLRAHGQKNADGAVTAYVSYDGAPSAEFFDRIYVNGPNVGAATTVHVDGLLTDLYRVEGNNRNQFNYPQGVDAFVYLTGLGNTPAIHLTSYRAGADVFENHSGGYDYATTVGGYFDIGVRLYGDVASSDTYFRSPQNSSDGVTQGRFLTTLRGDSSNVSLLSASGHVYQAVPEPGSFAALGLGVLALMRRRRAP